MFEELQNGKFVIIDGVIHTLTPLNNIKDIEDGAKREAEALIRSEMSSEQLIRELGRAGEFFTENGWRYYFVDKKSMKHLILAAPFIGGEMGYKSNERKYTIYVPNGWLAMDITINQFPDMTGDWRIIPRITTEAMRDCFDGYQSTFRKVHPHCFEDGRLCGGMEIEPKFDINLVVQRIKDCILGSKKETGTSIWDYNNDSPAVDIAECVYGRMALEMHKQKKTDDEIWREIIKAKTENRKMDKYREE